MPSPPSQQLPSLALTSEELQRSSGVVLRGQQRGRELPAEETIPFNVLQCHHLRTYSLRNSTNGCHTPSIPSPQHRRDLGGDNKEASAEGNKSKGEVEGTY